MVAAILLFCHSGARAKLANPESRNLFCARFRIPDRRFAAFGMTVESEGCR